MKKNSHSLDFSNIKRFCTGERFLEILVLLVRVELHLLGLGVSISPLIALVIIELHSLGLATVYINKVSA